MKNVKSPFLIVQNCISPLLCEQIVDGLGFVHPDTTNENEPCLTVKQNERFENILFQVLQRHVEDIETHYNVKYRGTKPFEFKWYPQDCTGDPKIVCENAFYKENKKVWVKNRDRDITGIIFMSDYNTKTPFETDYEVFGGKYEFPQHGFGFQAQRGTMILYPSDPHFLNKVVDVELGDLFLCKFHISTMEPFLYDPKQFPGDMTTWFEEIA